MNSINTTIQKQIQTSTVSLEEEFKTKPNQAYDSIKRFLNRGELSQSTYRIIKENPRAAYAFFCTIDSLNLSPSKVQPINHVREEDWIKLIKIFKKEELFQHYVRESITGASAAPLMIHRTQVEKITQTAMGKTGILSGTLLFYANDLFAICAALTGFVGLLSAKPGAMEKSSFEKLIDQGYALLKFAGVMVNRGFTTLSNYIWVLSAVDTNTPALKTPSLAAQCRAAHAINLALQECFL